LLPPALYLGIHLVEGESLTPMLLARRFTLNPVLIILSLVFWFWMWGMLGAILALPMLAILKIISDRLRPLKRWGTSLRGIAVSIGWFPRLAFVLILGWLPAEEHLSDRGQTFGHEALKVRIGDEFDGGCRQSSVAPARHPTAKCIMVTPPEA